MGEKWERNPGLDLTFMALAMEEARRWTSKNTRATARKANREPAGPLVSQSLESSHHRRILPIETFEMLAESQAAESILRYSVPRNKFLSMQAGGKPTEGLACSGRMMRGKAPPEAGGPTQGSGVADHININLCSLENLTFPVLRSG